MSARIRRNLPLLQLVYKSSPSVRRSIISNATQDFISALCEIALNLLKGNIPLNPKQFSQLKKSKTLIRFIADKKNKLLKKKKKINQKGGFLLPLLSAAIPLITGLFNRG